MELTIGRYTNKQLAEWFGIKEKTFSNTKEHRLEELKEYADFYEEKKKIIITNVKQEFYKKDRDKLEEILEQNWEKFLKVNSHLALFKDQVTEFWRGYHGKYSDATLYKYTAQWRTKKYGRILPKEKGYISVPIRKIEDIKEKNAYIYGIVINEEIVYIGKTKRPIIQRKHEHEKSAAKIMNVESQQQEYLYKAMRENPYEFVILYESHGEISNFQLQCLECGYINYYKPRFNYEGVQIPYRWGK